MAVSMAFCAWITRQVEPSSYFAGILALSLSTSHHSIGSGWWGLVEAAAWATFCGFFGGLGGASIVQLGPHGTLEPRPKPIRREWDD